MSPLLCLLEGCCLLLALLAQAVGGAYTVGIWPGDSCDPRNFHTVGTSLANEGCFTTGLDQSNIFSRLRLFRVICYGDSASSSWRIQGMKEYCNVYQLDFSGSGNGCVRWSGYNPVDASVRINCDNKGWDGMKCSDRGGDAICSSRICRENCCSASTDSRCASCSNVGACTSCLAGFSLTNGVCGKAAGATCSATGECFSGACLERCCGTFADPNCQRCGTAGECSACRPGYNAVGSRCLAQDGLSCFRSFDCASGVCFQGQCCCSKASGATCAANNECASRTCLGSCCDPSLAANCTLCGSLGRCLACQAGHTLVDGRCLAQDGQACSANTSCVSGRCLNRACCCSRAAGRSCGDNLECSSQRCLTSCCAPNADPRCTACGPSGECLACLPTHNLSGGRCLLLDGQACDRNASCLSGVCLGRACCCSKTAGDSCAGNLECASQKCLASCCAPTVDDPNCAVCGPKGTCQGCRTGYVLKDGRCLASDGRQCSTSASCASGVCSKQICCCSKPIGNACVDNFDCSSDRCLGSCCAPDAAADLNCVLCGPSGECRACRSSHVLAAERCLALNGQRCSRNASCASGVCGADRMCCCSKSVGDSCASNFDCSSRRCLASCCAAGVDSNCAFCGPSGECQNCRPGYELRVDQCLALNGQECSGDAQCQSGTCIRGSCCSAGVDSNCSSCSSAGTCLACTTGFDLNGTTCQATSASKSSSFWPWPIRFDYTTFIFTASGCLALALVILCCCRLCRRKKSSRVHDTSASYVLSTLNRSSSASGASRPRTPESFL